MEKKYTQLSQLRPKLWRRDNGSYYMGEDERRLRSLLTKNEAEAVVRYDEQYGKQAPRNGERPRCDAAFEELLVKNHVRSQTTVDRHTTEWNEWASPVLGKMRVCDVEKEDIVRVLTRARTMPSKRTGKIRSDIHNLEKAMKLFFRLASEKGYYAGDNPVKLIGEDEKAPNPQSKKVRPERVFRRAEFELIAEHMDPNPGRYGVSRYGDKEINVYKHQTIALVGGEIGTRISELLALLLDDFFVDRGHRIVSVERQLRKKADGFVPENPGTWFTPLKGDKGKIGGKVRDVWLSDVATAVLDPYIERGLAEGWLREGGLLFPNFKHRPLVPGHVSNQWLSPAAERAGLRRFTSHDFRHTFISEALEGGVSIDDVALDTGHDPDMVKHVYGDIADRLAHYERMQARRPREATGNVIELARHRDRVA